MNPTIPKIKIADTKIAHVDGSRPQIDPRKLFEELHRFFSETPPEKTIEWAREKVREPAPGEYEFPFEREARTRSLYRDGNESDPRRVRLEAEGNLRLAARAKAKAEKVDLRADEVMPEDLALFLKIMKHKS